MKITHKNSPKAGLTEHLPPLIAQALIATGYADACPMPARGSAGWLAARNEQAQTATAPSAYDTVAGAPGITWGIQNQRSGKVNVIKRVDSDTFFFDAPPADCPRSIIQQFLDAAAVNTEANAVAIAAAKKAQEEQERKDKWAGHRTVMAAQFGSKPL
jgi:hypothetical protein